MISCSIRVSTQYRENYGDVNTPYWKMKGGVEFVFNNVDDSVMYAFNSTIDQVITELLEAKSDDYCSYELLSWEWIFGEPRVLSTEDLISRVIELETKTSK